jgi:hypothetical protein
MPSMRQANSYRCPPKREAEANGVLTAANDVESSWGDLPNEASPSSIRHIGSLNRSIWTGFQLVIGD